MGAFAILWHSQPSGVTKTFLGLEVCPSLAIQQRAKVVIKLFYAQFVALCVRDGGTLSVGNPTGRNTKLELSV